MVRASQGLKESPTKGTYSGAQEGFFQPNGKIGGPGTVLSVQRSLVVPGIDSGPKHRTPVTCKSPEATDRITAGEEGTSGGLV